ncbi:MAG: hypothetical protein PF444_08180 [Bacteroidales bacterium]|nr:hypothetical protein [Bacteroidales bacterium]
MHETSVSVDSIFSSFVVVGNGDYLFGSWIKIMVIVVVSLYPNIVSFVLPQVDNPAIGKVVVEGFKVIAIVSVETNHTANPHETLMVEKNT